ncbi:MAG: hypothetical protein WD382_09135 [Halofilum sp. (in: g-proteobacteria)]
MTFPLIPLLAALALPAVAADIDMDSAPGPDTDVDMPEVEVRQPNIDREIDFGRDISQPDVRLPQIDRAPPRTGLTNRDDDADSAGPQRPSVRGGTMQRDRQNRSPSINTREPATGGAPQNPEIRRPSTTIRAPASE